VALLALGAVALVANSLFESKPGRPRRAPAPANVVQEEPEAADDASTDPVLAVTSLAETLRRIALPERLPDPFGAPRAPRMSTSPATDAPSTPGETAPGISESVRLTALWSQDADHFAVLGGRICRPGDTLGSITLDAIADDGVWLSHWKGRDFLPLGESFTLITPAIPAANLQKAHHEG